MDNATLLAFLQRFTDAPTVTLPDTGSDHMHIAQALGRGLIERRMTFSQVFDDVTDYSLTKRGHEWITANTPQPTPEPDAPVVEESEPDEDEDVDDDGIGRATYSPEDNKLRLYPNARLDADTYKLVKEAGFAWAPKQELFVAPMWTPKRFDLLLQLCGEVGDEDTSLVDRAAERADRFREFSGKRAKDAERSTEQANSVSKRFEFGQPILVGHHSERKARKDAQRIENAMSHAVKMWETSTYWKQRAVGAVRLARYKERPDVRARRIKGLEADARKMEREKKDLEERIVLWQECNSRERALQIANYRDHGSVVRTDGTEGHSAWSALEDDKVTWESVRAQRLEQLPRWLAQWPQRWLEHLHNRIAYERAMMEESGGTVADRVKPEVGGACKCWASPRSGGWSLIEKVNKVSVSISRTFDGKRYFSQTMPFDKLTAVMNKAQVDQLRSEGRVIGETRDGFHVSGELPEVRAKQNQEPDPQQATIDAMKASLKEGVKVVVAPQLFPTPAAVAERMVDYADIQPNDRVLEPSAGTGAILTQLYTTVGLSASNIYAVEVNADLCTLLRDKFDGIHVQHADFLSLLPGDVGLFDRILMNPPFGDAADIKHIMHALDFLKPGGRLVAICADGPRQNAKLKPLTDEWEELPSGTFAGTVVRSALFTIDKEAAARVIISEQQQEAMMAAVKEPEPMATTGEPARPEPAEVPTPDLPTVEPPVVAGDPGPRRFSEEHLANVATIKLDPARFQNRMGAFGEATVKAIVDRGHYDLSREPVILWNDPNGGNFLLSGHSRYEGFRQLQEQGKAGAEINVKFFRGTEQEAIDYARLESNRGGQAEGLRSDVRAYQHAKAAGKSKAELLALFKKEAMLEKLDALSHLSARSRFLEAMESDAASSFPYLERNAVWIGQLRSAYPQLTDEHEGEIFDFIYKGDGLKLSKDKLFKRIEDKVTRIDFDPALPLNFAGGVATNAYTEPAREEIARLEREVETVRKEIRTKEDSIVRARGEGNTEAVERLSKQVTDRQAIVIRLLTEIDDWKKRISKAERELPGDLFTQEVEAVQAMPAKDLEKHVATHGKTKPPTKEQRAHLHTVWKQQAKEAGTSKEEILAAGRHIQLQRGFWGIVDERTENARRLAPTPVNFQRWVKAPGRYDLIGVDNYKRSNVTVGKRKLRNVTKPA